MFFLNIYTPVATGFMKKIYILLILVTFVMSNVLAQENNAIYESTVEMYSSGNNTGSLVEYYLFDDSTYCRTFSSYFNESIQAGKWQKNGDSIIFDEIRQPIASFYILGQKDENNTTKRIKFYGYSLSRSGTVLFGTASDGNLPNEMRRIVEKGQMSFAQYYTLLLDENITQSVFFAVQVAAADYEKNNVLFHFEEFRLDDVKNNLFIVSFDERGVIPLFHAEGKIENEQIIFPILGDEDFIVTKEYSKSSRDSLLVDVKKHCIDPAFKGTLQDRKNTPLQIKPIKSFDMKIAIPRTDNPYFKNSSSL
jgi:hypothetical protein